MGAIQADRNFHGVLLVFQDPPVLDVAAEFCMQRGLAVLTLPTYQEAMLLLQRQYFQFVLADASQQGIPLLNIIQQMGLQNRMEHLVLVGQKDYHPESAGEENLPCLDDGSGWVLEMAEAVEGLRRFRRQAADSHYFLWQVLPDFHCIRCLFDIASVPRETPTEKGLIKKMNARQVSFS